MQGSAPGAVILIGFAVVAGARPGGDTAGRGVARRLATWVAIAIGGYLAQAAVLPAWKRDVRDLAGQRRDAARVRRGRARSGARRPAG